jgi:ABC-type polar amino acid transport system ATPase subunit
MAGSGKTMVIVTHEIGFAREIADRISFMTTGASPSKQLRGVFSNTDDDKAVGV